MDDPATSSLMPSRARIDNPQWACKDNAGRTICPPRRGPLRAINVLSNKKNEQSTTISAITTNEQQNVGDNSTPTYSPTSPLSGEWHTSVYYEQSDCPHCRRGSTLRFRTANPDIGDRYPLYSELGPKCKALCAKLWSRKNPDQFRFTKLPGGSYNRIIAIKVLKKNKCPPRKRSIIKRAVKKMILGLKSVMVDPTTLNPLETIYSYGDFILRIPKFWVNPLGGAESFDFEANVRHHLFAKEAGVTVPDIVHFDPTPYNEINSPYLLMEQVKGRPLNEVYFTMPLEQKIEVAEQIGVICKKLTWNSVPTYGDLTFTAPLVLGPNHMYRERQIAVTEPGCLVFGSSMDLNKVGLFASAYAHWKRLFLVSGYAALYDHPYDHLLHVAVAFGKAGYFGGPDSQFAHNDFYPRNIMVSIEDGHAHLTAVLDWDNCAFEPPVVACRAPSWLWQSVLYYNCDEEDDLEFCAGDEPSNEDDRKIKAAFDNAVGEGYTRVAYMEHAPLARKLVMWTKTGSHDKLDHRVWSKWVLQWIGEWETYTMDGKQRVLNRLDAVSRCGMLWS